jgi:hypothetical protein
VQAAVYSKEARHALTSMRVFPSTRRTSTFFRFRNGAGEGPCARVGIAVGLQRRGPVDRPFLLGVADTVGAARVCSR